MTIEHLKSYARRIRDLLRANPATPEPGLAPAFQQLLTDILPTLPGVPQLTVSPEFNNPGVGRPDIALIRPGQPPRAFTELKSRDKSANPTRWRDPHDRRQFERLKELAHWSASNFVDFYLFHRDQEFGRSTIVPERALRPETPDATANRLIEAHDPAQFFELLATLARASAPAARDAVQLAALLAHSARLVRGIVQDRLVQLRAANVQQDPLLLVRETFRNVLYAHPEAAGYPALDFDILFSSAFAQTLAFGLLLVREALATTPGLTDDERRVGAGAWEHMPEEHPLMRAALRVLSEPEITREIGIGFDVMCDTVNSFELEILAIQPNGRDPILYFYEDFLETFDPEAREKYGVYYTPIEVVRYIVGALNRALRQNLHADGLRDPGVHILDPATGTGTFLLGIAERVRDQVLAEASPAEAAMSLAELAERTFGFELLVGPYAVAHYRLHHSLRTVPAAEGEAAPDVHLPRLGIYLADTLSEPDADTPVGMLGIQGIPINEERHEANRIKTQQSILAITGNPPYRRLRGNERETLVGRWMAGGVDADGGPVTGVWDDLKQPVIDAGHGNQLNTFEEFSIAFWRWAIWKLFDSPAAPQRGVIAFISNRKFLTGWPYAGLRKMMRERFDRIEIIDLRGDINAGAPATVDTDQGVFAIRVGTAITMAIATGEKAEGQLADVVYHDTWTDALFTRRAKLDWLQHVAASGDAGDWVSVDRGLLEDFRPEGFQGESWISIREVFAFSKSGMKSGNDALFVRVQRGALCDAITPLLANRADPTYDPTPERYYGYRPLDRRWFYNDLSLLDRPGPAMQQAWGETNVGLYSLKSNTGAGPAVWCHGLLPDYHAIKGSNGGYAFPLFDRRRGPSVANISEALLAALTQAYGEPVSAEDVFDSVLALLSASSFTRRFAGDLEDKFPHVMFPAAADVFKRAVTVGRQIREVEAFARVPQAQGQAFCRVLDQPTGNVVFSELEDGEIALCADGSGRISGIPLEVWDFSVSGYRVLPRWIEGRVGLPADLALVRELRDVAARIDELIHHFDEGDLVLQDTLANSLPREELGLTGTVPEPMEEEDGGD